MRKFFALLLMLTLVCSLLPMGITVMAAEYTDYVPGEMPQNLVVNFADSFWHADTQNDSKATLTGINWANGVGYCGASMTAKSDIATVSSFYGSAGMAIGTTTNATYPKIDKAADTYAAGENYIFMFAARNINKDIPASIRLGVWNGTWSGSASDFLPVTQYENGIIDLPQSGEWVVVKSVLPESKNRTIPAIRLGFIQGTAAGAAVEFNSRHSGIQQAYYAKEVPYNIKAQITSGESTFYIGDTAELEASVVNQIDIEGYLKQNFEWVLLDSDLNPVEDGYTITPSADGTTASFECRSLAGGEYTIAATSKDYGMTRFIPINVVSKFEISDYRATVISDNLIITPTKSSMVSTGTSNVVGTKSDGLTYPEVYIITANQDIAASDVGNYYECGFLYKKEVPDGGYVAGDRYLFSAYVRNTGTTDANVIAGLSNGYNVKTQHGSNYGAGGMCVPADGKWYQYKEILTVNGTNPILSFGFPAGTKAGSKVEINLTNPALSPSYFAKEAWHDIKMNASKTSAVYGDTVELNASVVNQLGDEGNIKQSFTWYILDENKNYKNSGYTLETSADSATLNITSDKDELIYAVAVSTDYSIARMLPIALNGKVSLVDYVKGDMPRNLIVDPSATANFADASANYTMTETGDWGLKLSATFAARADVTSYGGNYSGASGFLIKNTGAVSTGIDVTEPLTGGKAYVFSADVKNANGTGDIVLDVGLSNSNYWSAAKPVECDSGYTIPAGDDWYKLAGTMKLPGNAGGEYSPYLTFGFGIGTKAGDKFELNMAYPTADTLYFAAEEPYDIAVTNLSDSMTVQKGDSVSFRAELLNQIGSTGYLNQSFTWYVRADDNTDASSYFTMNVSDDTRECTLIPKGKAKGGSYDVIAASDDYAEFVRFETFFVSDDTTTIYVSPDGDDMASGSVTAPLATLGGAIDKIRKLKEENITVNEVIFYPGEYRFTDTAYFTQEDVYDVPVTFRAMEPGKTIFKGSQFLDASDFTLVTNPDITSRFAPGMAGKIYSLDLAAAGYSADDLTDISQINGQYGLTGDGEFNTLYYDGVEQIVSQWPDGGSYAIKGDRNRNNGDEANSEDGLSFIYYDEGIDLTAPSLNCDRWKNASDFWISSFEPYDYSRFRYYVKSIDTDAHTITICDNPAQVLTNERSGRWKAFNLIEEITVPGEYAIDTQSMQLYYYPQGALGTSDIEFSAFSGAMVDISNCRNIVFDSIVFTQTRDDAISMTDVSDISIVNCDFTDIASIAVQTVGTQYAESGRASWQTQRKNGANRVVIKGNNFINIGHTAISLDGSGDVDTLTSSGNLVEDNYINGTSGKSFWEAITLGGCGVTVRNNNISSVPMQAIRAWGSNHLIEYNEIYDVVTEDADCGAIYWGGSSIYQGTVVRYNYIHDTEGTIDGGQVGVYWDDTQIGQTAKYNIFANQDIDFNSNGAGAIVHHYNTTYNANTTLSHQDHLLRGEDTITRDVFYSSLEAIRDDISDLDLYYKMYPYLKNVIGEGNNPTKYTSIKGNLAVAADAVKLRNDAPKYAVIENNTQLGSSDAFADVDAQDFRLNADSDLARANPHLLNTDNFDIERIGLIRDITMGSFSAVYPANDSYIINSDSGITFSWNRAMGANSYRVVVATDSLFENVVYSGETMYNSVTVPSLDSGTYYWQVYAVNSSREFAQTWAAQGGVNRFKLTDDAAEVTFTTPVLTDSTEDKISLSLIYNGEDTKSFTVYVAGYDKDGRLGFANAHSIKAAKGQSFDIDSIIPDGKLSLCTSFKIFAWKELITPLTGGFINFSKKN